MKKGLMFILLLLGLACAGGGVYIFYLKPQMDAEKAAMEQVEEPAPIVQEVEMEPLVEEKPPVTEFYVNPPQLGIREYPDYDAFVDSVIYQGDKVFILEERDGWGRISPYYVYEEGGEEVAEWLPMEALVEEPPVVSKEERNEILTAFIENSDDFKEHQEMFLAKTDELLKEGTCKPFDFEELGGWVRSVRFGEDVYFVYCGGLNQANKIYLNIQTGKIFY